MCSYCKKRGASIGCWIRQCRKSLHLPCAIENNCAYEFTYDHRSYCDIHCTINTLNTSETHEIDEICKICGLSMGNFNRVKSIKLLCCADGWFHKGCLKQMAFTHCADFKCPSCKERDEFRYNMRANGIFIPHSSYQKKTDDQSEPQPKRRRVHKEWFLEKSFECKNDAIDFIVTEKCWSYYYSNKSNAGLRITYRCNMMKFRGKQCEAAVYLLYNSTDTSVKFYRADSIHTHLQDDYKDNAVKKISGQVEVEIRRMFDDRFKPKAILSNLVKNGLQPPSKAKLTTFLSKLRKEKFGNDRINFGLLDKWLKEKNIIPDDEHEPFVVDYNIQIDDQNEMNSAFRFFVSTKLVFGIGKFSEKIHTDATYKLIWQGYPLLLVGTTDSNRRFHPIGTCVSTNERSADFEFMFRTMKNSLIEIFDFHMNPRVLICDAAKSIQCIHNGFKSVFGDRDNIIMCWAHIRRNVVKNLPRFLRDKKKQSEFLGKK